MKITLRNRLSFFVDFIAFQRKIKIMKIALIGYGKMGHAIERIARERGHEIVAIIDVDNSSDMDSVAFAEADAAIEFTTPWSARGLRFYRLGRAPRGSGEGCRGCRRGTVGFEQFLDRGQCVQSRQPSSRLADEQSAAIQAPDVRDTPCP